MAEFTVAQAHEDILVTHTGEQPTSEDTQLEHGFRAYTDAQLLFTQANCSEDLLSGFMSCVLIQWLTTFPSCSTLEAETCHMGLKHVTQLLVTQGNRPACCPLVLALHLQRFKPMPWSP